MDFIRIRFPGNNTNTYVVFVIPGIPVYYIHCTQQSSIPVIAIFIYCDIIF